jgi:6-phosphogluconolactonase (cycloisomerase 2 family)
MKNLKLIVSLIISILLLSSCGGGGSKSSPAAPVTYKIGGSVIGFAGTGLVLQNNGGDSITIPSGATTFKFPTGLASSASHSVTVLTQPTTPSQSCNVVDGSGTATSDISSISVFCVTLGPNIVSGSISGLTGTGLVLQNNGGNNLTITAKAPAFNFATSLSSGNPYNVSVKTQPTSPLQTCTVNNASGTVGTSVSNISVSCVVLELAFVGHYNSIVSSYTVNTETGALTALEKGGIGSGSIYAMSVASDPSQKFLYVVDGVSKIVGTSITQLGTLVNPVSSTAGTNPNAVVVNSSGKYLYATNNNSGDITAYSINSTSGALTPIGAYLSVANFSGSNPNAVAVGTTSGGEFLYVTNATSASGVLGSLSVFRIGSAGTLTPLANSPFTTRASPCSVAVDPSGKYVYVVNKGSDEISAYSVDVTTGNLSSFPTPFSSQGKLPSSIAIDPTGKFAYVANHGDNNVAAFSIDSTTGELLPLGVPLSTGNPNAYAAGVAVPNNSVSVDPLGKFLYVTNFSGANISIFNIATTGQLTANSASPMADIIAPWSITITKSP